MAEPKANEIILKLKAENKLLKKKMKESTDTITKSTTKISKSASSMSGMLKKAGALILTYFGARAIKSFVNLAGEVDSVTGSFYNLAQGAEGGAEGLLKAMQVASKGTVDNLEIMKSSNLAFQLMGDQVADQLPQMMKVAMAAAKAQGGKVADMFNDIVVASGRRSVMILDNLGISSAVAGKYQEEFARSLGLTRDKLNETQKSQAFFYAVMKAGGELIQKTGGESLTLGERIQIINSRMKNAAITASQIMVPALENLLGAFLDIDITGTSLFDNLVKGAAKFINNIAAAIKIVKAWAANDTKHQDSLRELSENTYKSYKKLEPELAKLAKMDKNYGDSSRASWTRMVRDIEKATNGFKDMGKVIDKGLFSRDQVYKSYRYVSSLRTAKNAQDELTESTKSYSDKLAEIEEDRKRREAEIEAGGAKRAVTTPFGQGAGGGAGEGEDTLQAKIKYYEYIDEYRNADLLKEEEAYQEILDLKTGMEKDKLAINKAYRKKQLLAEQDARNKRIQYDEAVLRAKLKFDTAEYQSAKELFSNSSTLMQSKNKFLFKMGQGLAYASALMSAAEGIAKVWSVWGAYPPIAAAFSAIVAAATGVQIASIKNTKLPSYKRGRIPMFETGFTPADHFPAMIGAKEAVINERSTLANLDVLKAMNDNPGARVETGTTVNQNISLSGNVMSKDFILNQVLPEFEKQARYMGKTVFAEKK